MRKIYPIFILAALILGACAGQTGTTSEAITTIAPESLETAAPVETEATEALPETEAVVPQETEEEAIPVTGTEARVEAVGTDPAASESAAQSGSITYRIVPEESSVSYSVGETFLNQGNAFNTAVGTTDGISGTMQVDFTNPQNTQVGPLTIDISGLQSDSARRDGAIRDRFLESSRFPIVTFVTREIEGLPETIDAGTDYNLRLNGDLTIRDVTQPASFDVTARLEGDELRGQAQNSFLMSQFGFGPISIAGIVNTQDEVKISVDFVARPVGG